jgi:hypothetical protein
VSRGAIGVGDFVSTSFGAGGLKSKTAESTEVPFRPITVNREGHGAFILATPALRFPLFNINRGILTNPKPATGRREPAAIPAIVGLNE